MDGVTGRITSSPILDWTALMITPTPNTDMEDIEMSEVYLSAVMSYHTAIS